MLRPSLPLLCCAALAFGSAAPLHAQEAAPADPVVVDGPTEQTLQGALRFLASQQQASGAWGGGEGRRSEHPVAITGYVLLAFMACGHLPEEGDYARQVAAGMDFLLDSLQPDGTYRGVDGSKYMYNHGIATIALSELYGQTRSPAMRVKLDRAIQLIVRTQSERGEHRGGWRYRPQPSDADISVTVLQVVALRSAKNGGIAVPQATIDDAIDYVKRCRVGNTGGFSYQAGGGAPGFARTAAAIYSLQVCGLYDDPLVKAGSDYLFETSRPGQNHWTYGCAYAGPAQYMIGGDTWRRWYALQKEHLLKTAQRDGEKVFWKGEVGAVYCTAAYTSILAMPWHYLPLYQR